LSFRPWMWMCRLLRVAELPRLGVLGRVAGVWLVVSLLLPGPCGPGLGLLLVGLVRRR
jgi:hypothetical protein